MMGYSDLHFQDGPGWGCRAVVILRKAFALIHPVGYRALWSVSLLLNLFDLQAFLLFPVAYPRLLSVEGYASFNVCFLSFIFLGVAQRKRFFGVVLYSIP